MKMWLFWLWILVLGLVLTDILDSARQDRRIEALQDSVATHAAYIWGGAQQIGDTTLYVINFVPYHVHPGIWARLDRLEARPTISVMENGVAYIYTLDTLAQRRLDSLEEWHKDWIAWFREQHEDQGGVIDDQ
jgi:hypothetical protein